MLGAQGGRALAEKLAEKADLHPNYDDPLMRIAAALQVSVTRFFPGL